MPINLPPNHDYSDLLASISNLNLQGGGSVGMKFSRSVDIMLTPNNETVILGSTTDCVREIYLINQSDSVVDLWWNDGVNITPVPSGLIKLGSTFQDWTDGGFELRAKSDNSANLKLLVRSTDPINYQVGIIENNTEDDDEMPINLIINQGLKMNGGQLFYADSFKDGHEYNFTFTTNGIDINNNLKIYLFPITFLSIPQISFNAQRDWTGNYINPIWQLEGDWQYDKLEMLDNSRVHHFTTPDIEISFNLSFFRSKFIIAFGALISIPGIGEDDQLFNDVDYVPNADPLLGGTFVLNNIFPQ